MSELKTNEIFFPFICDNAECKCEYDLEGFSNIILQWGFIYLKNDKNCLIGATCPKCFQTTIRKYKKYPSDFSLEDLEAISITHNNGLRLKEDIIYFVPFSVKILTDLQLIKLTLPQQVPDNENAYKISGNFEQRRVYPGFIENEFPYSIAESNVPLLLEIENKDKYKAFPRIVELRSCYWQLDSFLTNLRDNDEISQKQMGKLAETLYYQIQHQDDEYITRKHFVKNNLTKDEYDDMNFCYTRDAYQKNIRQFLYDYKKIRNRIDFEIIYRDEFLNKYARKFYFEPGYKAEQMQMAAMDQQEAMENYNEEEVQRIIAINKLNPPEDCYLDDPGIQPDFDSPIIDPLLTESGIPTNNIGKAPVCGHEDKPIVFEKIEQRISVQQVMKKWTMNEAEIMALIYDGLPVYFPTGERVNPYQVNHMQPGLMQIMLLKPSDIKEFEKKVSWISDEGQGTLDPKEARKLGQLEREKEKWNDSIISSVQIGMWAAGKKELFRRDDVKDKLCEINPDIPDTVFEKIWKAIPEEKRHKGGRPKKLAK